MADNDPRTPNEAVLVAVGHQSSWATPGQKHVGGLMGTVDVVVAVAVVHHMMGSGPGRPVNTHGRPHGPGGAAHTEPTSHGPRPGPAHQISRGSAAARPGPSVFQRIGRGPAQRIASSKISRPGPSDLSRVSARPGPAHDIGGEGHETRALFRLAHHFCGPVCGFDGPGHGPAHVLPHTKRSRHAC